nr:unnamed protein product [Haemonchus contortus]
MVKFVDRYIEEASAASEIDTGQVPIVKKQKNEGLIARLRSRLHRKIISAFRPSLLVKSKQSQPLETPSRVPPGEISLELY